MPIILAMPALGVPAAPWQLAHFALYVASAGLRKTHGAGQANALARTTWERIKFFMV